MSIYIDRSLSDHFFISASTHGQNTAFAYYENGEFVPITYAQAAAKVKRLASFLKQLGVKSGDRVAILSENRYEWALFDLAILTLGAVTVPIYPTLSAEQVKVILKDCGAKVTMVSNLRHLRTIEEVNLKQVKHIVTLFAHKKHHTFEEAVVSKPLENLPAVSGDQLASIVYTSGTTGTPKGVMLTHANFLSNIEAVLQVVSITHKDIALSFLPLSHVLERMGGYYLILSVGASIYYARSIDTLAEDLQLVRPTVMVAVPRLYEKMYAKILKQLDDALPVKKKLFDWALKTGKQYMEAKKKGKLTLALRAQQETATALVFSKIRRKTGGRLRFFVSGGAPLKAHLGNLFLWAGIPIIEGYGLTETSPVLAVNDPKDPHFGTVGKPLHNVHIELAKDGEICVSGPNVMQGYWKRPTENKKCFTKKGLFKTGDIGEFTEDGFLVLTDRKKDLIVLSNGKNVAPQPVQEAITKSRFISQAILFGEGMSYVVALLVPDWSALQTVLKKWKLDDTPPQELIKDERVHDFLMAEVSKCTQQFARFEQVKQIGLLVEEFSQAKGELTPTMKMKRPIIAKTYSKVIEELYS